MLVILQHRVVAMTQIMTMIEILPDETAETIGAGVEVGAMTIANAVLLAAAVVQHHHQGPIAVDRNGWVMMHQLAKETSKVRILASPFQSRTIILTTYSAQPHLIRWWRHVSSN